jgi:hypothetical protein
MMKPDGSKQFEKQGYGWEDNLKMDIQEMGWEAHDRIDLAQCDFMFPQRCKGYLRSSYRRFGTSYRSHVQGASLSIVSSRLLPEDGTDGVFRNVSNNQSTPRNLTQWLGLKVGSDWLPQNIGKTNLRSLTSLTALV